MVELAELERFVVRAKARTYAGSGQTTAPSRPGSVDLAYREGPYAYLDSYFGASDFLGQELVSVDDIPAWAMNYYGYLLRPDLIDAPTAGGVIKSALTTLYGEGRFLGGFRWLAGDTTYTDTNTGDLTHFEGREWIDLRHERVYELIYHGGLVRV
jgi:hypothetical protein